MQTQNRTTVLDHESPPYLEAFASASAASSTPAISPTSRWREPMLRGALAILMGVVLIALPITAAFVLAIAFGVYVLVDGVFTIMHASQKANPEAGRWWAMLARGVLGIVVGVFAIIFPSAAAAALGTLIAIWAICAGVLEISAGARMRHGAGRETAIMALGVLTIVLGIVLLFSPILALVAQIYVLAAYAIVAGIGLVSYAMRLRKRTAAFAVR